MNTFANKSVNASNIFVAPQQIFMSAFRVTKSANVIYCFASPDYIFISFLYRSALYVKVPNSKEFRVLFFVII